MINIDSLFKGIQRIRQYFSNSYTTFQRRSIITFIIYKIWGISLLFHILCIRIGKELDRLIFGHSSSGFISFFFFFFYTDLIKDTWLDNAYELLISQHHVACTYRLTQGNHQVGVPNTTQFVSISLAKLNRSNNLNSNKNRPQLLSQANRDTLLHSIQQSHLEDILIQHVLSISIKNFFKGYAVVYYPIQKLALCTYKKNIKTK